MLAASSEGQRDHGSKVSLLALLAIYGLVGMLLLSPLLFLLGELARAHPVLGLLLAAVILASARLAMPVTCALAVHCASRLRLVLVAISVLSATIVALCAVLRPRPSR